jgi:transposase
MEAPMKRGHCIALDTHCSFCEAAALDPKGSLVLRQKLPTAIPDLTRFLETVPRPRRLVIEEGPLANWLWRNLRSAVDEMVVAEPRRNRLICEEGDKDDDIDAEKLAHLFWGGFIKAVHQVDSIEQTVFRQHVSLYHGQVRQRVREGHRIWCLFRRHGVMVRSRDFSQAEARPALLERLPAHGVLRDDVSSLFASFDQLAALEETFRRRLIELAKQVEVIRRFEEMPGIGWVRAATLYAYLDTPWRFRSKEALWKYLGIGLERRRSGNGPTYLAVPKQVSRLLKSTILGAAKSAAAQGANPFADHYERWLSQGLSRDLARRNAARLQSATLWGLWKNGSVYHPEWVGQASAAINALGTAHAGPARSAASL